MMMRVHFVACVNKVFGTLFTLYYFYLTILDFIKKKNNFDLASICR